MWFGIAPQAMLRQPWLRLLAVLLAVLVGLALQGLIPETLRQFDERSANLTWGLADSSEQERRIVLVDIDEKSVKAIGPWPWSRDQLARLVEGLNHYQVGLKLYDVVLPDPKPEDERLRQALTQGGPNVWAQVFSLNPHITVRSGQPAGALASFLNCPSIAESAYGYVANHPGLLTGNTSAGHITPIVDPDGVVRRVPALICQDGRSYPSLVLEGLLQANLDPPYLIQGRGVTDPPWQVSLKNLPEVSLPLNEQGQLRVSYQIPRDGFVSISAQDVIERRVPADLLQGVWALVGSTAFGVGDAIPTPQGGNVGGLEVHAQLLAAALDGRTPRTPRGAWILSALITALALAFLLVLMAAGEGQKKLHRSLMLGLPLVGLVMAGLLYSLHALALLQAHVWIGWSLPGLVIILAAVLLSGVELARLRWEKTRLLDNLSSYLSAPVAQEIGFSESTESIEASRRHVLVLSASLRNFDVFCEVQPPEESASVLHQYLSEVNQLVLAHGGVLHQVQGADLLAVWFVQGSAHQAVAAAQELWTVCGALCDQWQPCSAVSSVSGETGDVVVPPLELGLGMECGSTLVGSLGPPDRRVHAVLGEPVQVAHGLQAMTCELSYPILIGPNLHRELVQDPTKAHETICLGEFLLPGTYSARVVHAAVVKFNTQRLRLILGQGEHRHVA